MIVKILGAVIGALVLIAGLVCLSREKHDPESRKIYTVISIVGGVLLAVMLLLLLLAK